MNSAHFLRRPLVALAIVLSLAACNGDEAHKPFTIAVTTPNGEPLATPPLQGFDSPGCPAILGTWFDRIDTRHDGVIDRAEFMADAEIQFNRMDLNHDGTITPGTLAQYRAGFEGHEPLKPLNRVGGGGGDGSARPVLVADASSISTSNSSSTGASGSSGGSNPGYGKKSRSISDLVQGGGYDPRVEPDPVMSADTSLRFQVTKKDFMDQAARRFAKLDMDRAGRITRQQAMLWCLKQVRWPDQVQ
ncbi:MAG TPA: EF-hand domain-containing protein [Aliidongia sp.]|uniref:EF-hand domain-containing protein n=1 Tax=Aliidongia sp. TaxID=1914230 RepID=UPI002DDD8D80|nr:EF-hand domain-containing protein [Aliidongia sp.]HEV2673731.1 EF-hand domain-containing protein [Aliidongia sp.]